MRDKNTINDVSEKKSATGGIHICTTKTPNRPYPNRYPRSCKSDKTGLPAVSVNEARDVVCDEPKGLVCCQSATWLATQTRTLKQKEQTHMRAISGGTPGKGAMIFFSSQSWPGHTSRGDDGNAKGKRSDGYIWETSTKLSARCIMICRNRQQRPPDLLG